MVMIMGGKKDYFCYNHCDDTVLKKGQK